MRIIGILFLAAERDGRLGVWTVHVFFLTYLRFVMRWYRV